MCTGLKGFFSRSYRQEMVKTRLESNCPTSKFSKFPIFCCQTLWLSGDLHEEMSGKVFANRKACFANGT